jgi:hypothetical protein
LQISRSQVDLHQQAGKKSSVATQQSRRTSAQHINDVGGTDHIILATNCSLPVGDPGRDPKREP